MIWVIGCRGMLGQELTHYFDSENIPYKGTDLEVSILDKAALEQFARENHPTWIVNCSAYTAVDQAEEESDKAFLINETGVENISKVASDLDIPLIHLSTDYVFDGSSDHPVSETEAPDPIGVYGASKLAGEQKIQENWAKHFIIRTAWLYGQYGPNFVETMLRLMNEKESLSVVDDQIGSPTWTKDLVRLIALIIAEESKKYGIYHFSGEGECSWWEFAVLIYRYGQTNNLIHSKCDIKPCSSDNFPTKAKRPAYSLLSKKKVLKQFHFTPPLWVNSLSNYLEEKADAAQNI